MILVLTIGWIRELTLRRAIQSTVNFMAPFSKKSDDVWGISYHEFGRINIITENDPFKFRHTLGWCIGYDPDALRNGINVHVTMFGKVVYVGHGEIMEILRLRESNDREGIINAFKTMKPL